MVYVKILSVVWENSVDGQYMWVGFSRVVRDIAKKVPWAQFGERREDVPYISRRKVLQKRKSRWESRAIYGMFGEGGPCTHEAGSEDNTECVSNSSLICSEWWCMSVIEHLHRWGRRIMSFSSSWQYFKKHLCTRACVCAYACVCPCMHIFYFYFFNILYGNVGS